MGLHFKLLYCLSLSKFLPTLHLQIFNKRASLEIMKQQQTQIKFKSEIEGGPTYNHFNNRQTKNNL